MISHFEERKTRNNNSYITKNCLATHFVKTGHKCDFNFVVLILCGFGFCFGLMWFWFLFWFNVVLVLCYACNLKLSFTVMILSISFLLISDNSGTTG